MWGMTCVDAAGLAGLSYSYLYGKLREEGLLRKGRGRLTAEEFRKKVMEASLNAAASEDGAGT